MKEFLFKICAYALCALFDFLCLFGDNTYLEDSL